MARLDADETNNIRDDILKDNVMVDAGAMLWTAADGKAFCPLFWRIEFVPELSLSLPPGPLNPFPLLKIYNKKYCIKLIVNGKIFNVQLKNVAELIPE